MNTQPTHQVQRSIDGFVQDRVFYSGSLHDCMHFIRSQQESRHALTHPQAWALTDLRTGRLVSLKHASFA